MAEHIESLGNETLDEHKEQDVLSSVKPRRGRKKQIESTASDVPESIVTNLDTESDSVQAHAHEDTNATTHSESHVFQTEIKTGAVYPNPDGIRLYKSCVATRPDYRYMGNIAIWSDDCINHRVRITDASIHAGIHSKLIGWVNIEELGGE